MLEDCRSDGSQFVHFYFVGRVEKRWNVVVDVLNVDGDGHKRARFLTPRIGAAAENLEFQQILRRVSVHEVFQALVQQHLDGGRVDVAQPKVVLIS